MPFLYLDPTFLWILPGLILSLLAQSYVTGQFTRYSAVGAKSGTRAEDAARGILNHGGATDVAVEATPGHLSDHYDPRRRVLRLSEGVYGKTSVAALGIAAHEAGHALQHAGGYVFLKLRNSIYPVVRLCSTAAIPLLLMGILLQAAQLTELALWLYAGAIVFQLISLPVEFNASGRALNALAAGGYLTAEEVPMAKKVLRAAALTYVASFVLSLLQLLRLMALFGNRRRAG